MTIRCFVVLAAAIAAPLSAQAISVPAAIPAPAMSAGTARPKLICHSSVDTGSLVAHTRRCYTAQDWERLNEAHQSVARGLVSSNTGRGIAN